MAGRNGTPASTAFSQSFEVGKSLFVENFGPDYICPV